MLSQSKESTHHQHQQLTSDKRTIAIICNTKIPTKVLLSLLLIFSIFFSPKMMLSPSACRMGAVSTSRRKIGCATSSTSLASIGSRRAFVTANKNSASASFLLTETEALWTPRRLRAYSSSWSPLPHRRWKSTLSAAYEDSDSDDNDDDANADDESLWLETRTKGLAAAAELRASSDAAANASYEEAWMINLGRGSDNEWLTGPREEAWFTGVHPCHCPGASCLLCVVFVCCCCCCCLYASMWVCFEFLLVWRVI